MTWYLSSVTEITHVIFFHNKNSLNLLKQDVFVKHNAPDNGQFQRRPRSQRQIF